MSDYEIAVTENNVGLLIKDNVVIFRTRPCRLYVQSIRLAKDYLDTLLGISYEDAITLEVHNLITDPDSLFNRRR